MLPARPYHAIRLPRLAKPLPDGSGVDEADYARGMYNLTVAAMVLGVVALLLQLVQHKTASHWLTTIMLLLMGAFCALLHVRQQRLGTTCRPGQMALAFGLTLTTLVSLAYVGPFTAGVIVLAPMSYAYGFAPRTFKAWWVLAFATVGYAIVALLALTGAMDVTHGPIGLGIHSPTAIIGMTIFTETVLVVTFLAARKSRQLLIDAFHHADHAKRELLRRDAELSRARREMDHMVNVAAVGRLTGHSVAGYEVGEIVGRGGMGEVYRAWRGDAERPVALKVLNESMSQSPVHVERFFREARVCSALDSPHIIKVHDSGWAEEGYPYLAMDLLRGRDLSAYLADHHHLAIDEVAELVRQVGVALEAAHEAGIVHRDLKPENLFLSSRYDGQRWVVLDFGVSKAHNGTGTLTHGALIGTPNYMSPEQAAGKDVDHRSDVFALGSIAYCALTGRHAFDRAEPIAALMQVLHEQPPAPSAFANLDADVDLVLALALSKDRDRRFQRASDFAQALLDALDGRLDDDLRVAAFNLLRDCPWSVEDDDPPTMRPQKIASQSSGSRAPHTPPRRPLESNTVPLMDMFELTPETLVANTLVDPASY